MTMIYLIITPILVFVISYFCARYVVWPIFKIISQIDKDSPKMVSPFSLNVENKKGGFVHGR